MHAYVRDIMTTGVVTVRPDTPYREIAAMFREHRVSGFPVTAEDGKVTGVTCWSWRTGGTTAGTARPTRLPRPT